MHATNTACLALPENRVDNPSMTVPRSRPHDLGGSPAGPVDRAAHEPAFWEQRIDAMVNLMRTKGVISDWAELRAGIEALTPEDYARLGYYERWAVSAAEIAIRRKLVTREELDARIRHLMDSAP